MKKSDLVSIMVGLIGLVAITASIAIIYGYSKAIESKNTVSVNENITDNKSNTDNSDEKLIINDSNKNDKNTSIEQNNNSSEDINSDEHLIDDNLKAGKKIYIDKLNIADKQYEQIEQQLQTDANLPQGAMNALAGQQYKIYDDVLNEMYQYLRRNLPKDRAEELKQVQINWIEYKEKSIKESWPQEDGSMGPLIMNGVGATLTKERCYKILYTYFD